MTKAEQVIVQGELTDELNAPYAEPSSPFATPPGVDEAEFQRAMAELADAEYQRQWEMSEFAYDCATELGEDV